MPNIQTRSVHCADCDSESDFLRSIGLTVVGCDHSGGPGQCLISFFDPRLETQEAAPRAAAPVAAATSAPAASTPPPAPAPPPAAQPSPQAPAPALALPAAAPGQLTPTQARSCKAIVNLFETGDVVGLYGSVTVLTGDTGQLTFGRSQTTLGSGNLALLVERYAANPGARFGARLAPHLPRFQARDTTLNRDERVKNILRATADDPVMRDVQDLFFDETYWVPAQRACTSLGIATALGTAIVYDAQVHGSWRLLRDRTHAAVGTPASAGEQAWLTRYVQLRHEWLATNSNLLLRKTVYRMEAFARLIELDNWGLALPMVVRGQEISLQTMAGLPADAFDGPAPGLRPLALQSPLLKGLDIRLMQLGLSETGIDVRADGLFGRGSRDAVLAFQRRDGLPQTGTLDAATVLKVAAK